MLKTGSFYNAFVWIREMRPSPAEPGVSACEQIGHHVWAGYLAMFHVIVTISSTSLLFWIYLIPSTFF